MELIKYEYKADKVCTRCVMDDTVKGITFDEDGICTFCKINDELEVKFPLNAESTVKLNKIVGKIIINGKGKEYDCIVFRNGYSKDAPEMKVEWKGLREDKDRYAILLGKVIETKNI